jgi:hypothetical protein
MSNSKIHTLEGQLVIPVNRFEYCVFSNKTSYIELLSITEVLENIYKQSPSCNVDVNLYVYNNKSEDYVSVFSSKGELLKMKTNGVYDWFVGKHDLGTVIFNNIDKKAIIEIEDVDFSKYCEGEKEDN